MAIRGFLEGISGNTIEGWALDDLSPDSPVILEARLGDEVIGEALTSTHRADLADGGFSNNLAGFRMELGSPIHPSKTFSVDVYVRYGSDCLPLPRTKAPIPAFRNLHATPDDPIQDYSQFPVFVLGPARSGTSALILALLNTGKYVGRGEGHFLPIFQHLLSATNSYAETFASADRETHWGQIGAEAFRLFLRRAAINAVMDFYPQPHWVDKTPTVEMVRAAPLMIELWPNSKFIFLKRNVVENIRSRQFKFPHEPLEHYYQDWAAVVTAWIECRDELGSAAIEIEHSEMANTPLATANKLQQFLDLSTEQSSRLFSYISQERPGESSNSSKHVRTLADLHLTDIEITKILSVCFEPMKKIGFHLQ